MKTKSWKQNLSLVIVTSSLLLPSLAMAAGNVKLDSETKHRKKLDFDGSYVEGLNKRPLDSLMQVGDGDKKRKKAHLYHKRDSFAPETAETLQEMRYN